VAELNLSAGKRAKASTAYVSALKYLTAGGALLANDCWERLYQLTFALQLHRAECEFLIGALTAAEQGLAMLSARAANTVEQATVACLRVDLYTTVDQSDRAVRVCLDYLRPFGIHWSPHPTAEEARREYAPAQALQRQAEQGHDAQNQQRYPKVGRAGHRDTNTAKQRHVRRHTSRTLGQQDQRGAWNDPTDDLSATAPPR
jgi:predicted ATPase